MEKRRRFIHCYTGEGKGKTTAALGLTLRCVGAGWKVLFAQFLKHGEFSEIKALRRLGGQVAVRQFGSGRFVQGDPTRQDRALAEEGLTEVEGAMREERYDLVVLDEINCAVHLGILAVETVLGFLERAPQDVEIVMTGRNAPKELLDRADLVTEMRMIRHYHQAGVQARNGIEK